ncbi:MAG: type IV pilus twitching motility protein PilT [Campylobacter sp.]
MEQNFKVDVSELDFVRRNRVNEHLFRLIELGGTSLHIKSGSFIYARIGQEIKKFSDEILTQQDGIILAKELLRTRFYELVERKSVDFTHRLNDGSRFRVNIFFQLEGVSVVFRLIPSKIPTLQERFLPPVVEKICDTISKGLVFITGLPGSGKSTTVASMLERINSTKKQHIITIEDPIEFIHLDNKSIVSQRAIGQDALSFGCAIRDALREDPNVIYVGEIRDLDTIRACILASQNGLLVIGVLNFANMIEVLKFLTELFPIEERKQARVVLANNIQVIMAQKVVKALDSTRRTATSILINTPIMREAIIRGEADEIYATIDAGRDTYGMQTFDQHLFDMYLQGIIDEKEALNNSCNLKTLENKINSANSLKSDIGGSNDDLELIEQLKDEI